MKVKVILQSINNDCVDLGGFTIISIVNKKGGRVNSKNTGLIEY